MAKVLTVALRCSPQPSPRPQHLIFGQGLHCDPETLSCVPGALAKTTSPQRCGARHHHGPRCGPGVLPLAKVLTVAQKQLLWC